MSGVALVIDTLALPLASAQAGAEAAAALRAETERLYRIDQAARIPWDGEVAALALDLPATAAPAEMGVAIAQALRNRLARTGAGA